MSYLGDRALGSTIDFKFTTSVNGVPTTLAGSPVVSIYVGGSTTEFTTGVTLTADYDSRTGLNDLSIVASTGNGFAAGNDYTAVITTGTVGGVSQVGDAVCAFSIGLGNDSNLASQAITAAAGVTFPTSVAAAGPGIIGIPFKGDRTVSHGAPSFKFMSLFNGVPTALAGSPTLALYQGGTTTPVSTSAGLALTQSYNSVTGLNEATVTLSTASVVAGFDYDLVLAAGTLGGVSVAGTPIGSFCCNVTNVANIIGTDTTNPATSGNLFNLTTLLNNYSTTVITVGTGSTTTSVVTSTSFGNASFANQFAGKTITFATSTTTAALRRQSAVITASTASATPTLTIPGLTVAPVNGDTFIIHGGPVNANATQIAGQTVSASGAVTFPTDPIASTTNITAGTIATVSGNVNGNVGGNVTGSVGSVAGAVGSVTARVTANSDQIAGDATAATLLAGGANATTTGVVDSGATTTVIPTSSLSPPGAVANQFGNNVQPRYMIFDRATATAELRNQSTSISASTNAANPTFTVNALTTAPSAGDTFRLL